MKEVGLAISELRKEKGLGQKELGALLNLSVGTISNYENSVHSPDLNTLCKLADFFGVTTDYMLGRSGYRCPPEVLDKYFTVDYTVNNIINTILSFDSNTQNALIKYVNYLKETGNSTEKPE